MEFYDFPFSWECHNPNWRTHIFQTGRYTTNQPINLGETQRRPLGPRPARATLGAETEKNFITGTGVKSQHWMMEQKCWNSLYFTGFPNSNTTGLNINYTSQFQTTVDDINWYHSFTSDIAFFNPQVGWFLNFENGLVVVSNFFLKNALSLKNG